MATRKSLPDFDYRDRVGEGRKAELDEFAAKIGVKKIKDYNLYNRALSHKSFTNEQGWSHNEQYEKLEFFGDSVLGLVVNEYLFKSFPDYEEGDLSKIKSAAVSEPTLAEAAKKLGLGALILIGRGETRGGGTERPSLLADVLEAVIGAVYLDQGLPTARKFVLEYLKDSVHSLSDEESTGDYKSYFQEVVQKERGLRPQYSVMKSSGPDHSRKFKISVSIGGKRWGIGEGKSKKEAEQDAAENAFKAWEEAKKAAPKGRGPRKGREDGRGPARGERGEGRPRGSEQGAQGGFAETARDADRGPRKRGRGARARQMARSLSMEEVVAQGLDPVAAAAGALDYPFRKRAEDTTVDRPRDRFHENEPGDEAPDEEAVASGEPGETEGREAASDETGRGPKRGRRGRRGGRGRSREADPSKSGRNESTGRFQSSPSPDQASTSAPDEEPDAGADVGATPRIDRESDADPAGKRRRGRRRGGRGRSRGGEGRESAPTPESRPQERAQGNAGSPDRPATDAGSERGRSRRGGRGRGRGAKPTVERDPIAPRQETSHNARTSVKSEDLRPDRPVDDPISWAAGESFVRRPRRR